MLLTVLDGSPGGKRRSIAGISGSSILFCRAPAEPHAILVQTYMGLNDLRSVGSTLASCCGGSGKDAIAERTVRYGTARHVGVKIPVILHVVGLSSRLQE